jgi:hypothetical protein
MLTCSPSIHLALFYATFWFAFFHTSLRFALQFATFAEPWILRRWVEVRGRGCNWSEAKGGEVTSSKAKRCSQTSFLPPLTWQWGSLLVTPLLRFILFRTLLFSSSFHFTPLHLISYDLISHFSLRFSSPLLLYSTLPHFASTLCICFRCPTVASLRLFSSPSFTSLNEWKLNLEEIRKTKLSEVKWGGAQRCGIRQEKGRVRRWLKWSKLMSQELESWWKQAKSSEENHHCHTCVTSSSTVAVKRSVADAAARNLADGSVNTSW